MNRHGEKGSITVFLSLIAVLILSLICTSIESVRVQGARAQASNLASLGNYSVFGEYEKKLLEDYEIFAVDGAYGTGDFSIQRVNDRLKKFISYNTNPQKEVLEKLCFDPWKLQLEKSEIKEYALLTDQNGETFYQQAVAYMKATAITGTVSKLFQYYEDSQTAKTGQETYEKEKYSSDKQMKDLEKAEEEKKKELEEQQILAKQQAAEAGTEIVIVEESPADTVKKENPLDTINKLRKKSLLSIVCGNNEVSEKKISNKQLASKRSQKKGTMKVEKKHSGLTSDLLFREYLLDRFPNYGNCRMDSQDSASLLTGEKGNRTLDYQIEYILCGKKSDQSNLKAAAQRLLLLREGMNYLYCTGNSEMNAQAGSLAALLIGWIGIPALVTVLKHALLLGWAYGESLMDVRTLFDGGKIPLTKTKDTWMVTLDNLGKLNELLEEGGSHRQKGMSYKDYLRILLNLQSLTTQKKRALDMLELNQKSAPGLSNFQVDHCVVGIKGTTQWKISPIFLRVPAVFLGVSGQGWRVMVNSGFAYD